MKIKMTTPQSILARYCSLHEPTLASALAIEFSPQAAEIKMISPSSYGATRVDTIHTTMYVKFPTWQHAAAYHCVVRSDPDQTPNVIATHPISLTACTYEVYIEEARTQAKLRNPRVTTTVTFINRYMGD